MNDPVIESGKYIRLTSSALAFTGRLRLLGIWVSAASSTPTIEVFDNTAGSGAVAVGTFTPVAATWYRLPFELNTGCYVTISGTVDCTVAYKP